MKQGDNCSFQTITDNQGPSLSPKLDLPSYYSPAPVSSHCKGSSVQHILHWKLSIIIVHYSDWPSLPTVSASVRPWVSPGIIPLPRLQCLRACSSVHLLSVSMFVILAYCASCVLTFLLLALYVVADDMFVCCTPGQAISIASTMIILLSLLHLHHASSS